MTTATDRACVDHVERLLADQERVDAERMRRIEGEIDRLEQLMEAKMQAQAVAIIKSEDAYNARFASANEFRASLDDMTRQMVTREFVDTRLEGVDHRVGQVENRLSNYDGRILGTSAGIGLVVLIISIVAQLLGLGG